PPMAFLSEHRENDQRVLSQQSPSQMSLRSSGVDVTRATPHRRQLRAFLGGPVWEPGVPRQSQRPLRGGASASSAGNLRTRDCSPSEHVPPDGAEVSCRRVLSRAKHSPVSRKYSRSLQALH